MSSLRSRHTLGSKSMRKGEKRDDDKNYEEGLEGILIEGVPSSMTKITLLSSRR